jgi:hypothetical protein
MQESIAQAWCTFFTLPKFMIRWCTWLIKFKGISDVVNQEHLCQNLVLLSLAVNHWKQQACEVLGMVLSLATRSSEVCDVGIGADSAQLKYNTWRTLWRYLSILLIFRMELLDGYTHNQQYSANSY